MFYNTDNFQFDNRIKIWANLGLIPEFSSKINKTSFFTSSTKFRV